MRMRRQWKPLLWLVIPTLLATTAADSFQKRDSSGAVSRRAVEELDYHDIAGASTLQTSGKEIGTKDAPVDGLDGKPHAGPWVGKDTDSKKKSGRISDSNEKIPDSVKKLEKELSQTGSDSSSRIPNKNDGVMDDLDRPSPEEGTTGTEGGVSEKSKKQKQKEAKMGEKMAKKPAAPKEAPPLPHSEEQLLKEKAGKDDEDSQQPTEKPKGAVGLEKPTDLPASPKGKDSASTPRKGAYLVDTLPYTEGKKRPPPATDSKPLPATPTDETLIQPLHSFVLALIMILFSEIGDKTFLVAALMAMRHDRIVVFSAAFSALFVMTVLSAVLGHAVPSLLPRRLVAFAAAALFLVFGAKMLREGLAMPKDSGVGEEMKEVEAELEEKEHLARTNSGRRRGSSMSAHALEAGRGRSSKSRLGTQLPAPPESPSSEGSRSPSPSRGASLSGILGGLNNLFSLVLSPAWVQTFIMTFLGEWGDRSQIATIAMAAGQDYWWVTGGAVVGHAMCTGVAVLGGRALAGRVSLRVVTLGGAFAFLFFGLVYGIEALYSG
ncbi:GCR1-dependent translation factor 1 [Sphaceloma murrayae]|uniref:GCR1-dependent translation factor 1 n=1 Tax=Sphaceloma murrayae TaxID=2082308 RepID=A0A2K1QL23_9PEZI|nr:GCR1-dependent translation factor 1 [Sphaceloma murrayae]